MGLPQLITRSETWLRRTTRFTTFRREKGKGEDIGVVRGGCRIPTRNLPQGASELRIKAAPSFFVVVLQVLSRSN